MDFQKLGLGTHFIPSVYGPTCVDAVVAPTANDICRALDVFQCWNLATPVVVKVRMRLIAVCRVFYHILSPVEEHRIAKSVLALVGIVILQACTDSSLNCVSTMPPFMAISRYRSVMPSIGMIAYFFFRQNGLSYEVL